VVLVVVLLPVANDRAGLVNVVEGIHVQAFITHATVERFNVAVAPGAHQSAATTGQCLPVNDSFDLQ